MKVKRCNQSSKVTAADSDRRRRVSVPRAILRCLLLASLLMLLAGCSEITVISHDLTGTWKDTEGYMVSFDGASKMSESLYGSPLQYQMKGDDLVYSWPDGFIRSTPVSFSLDGTVQFHINGKDRTFRKSKEVIPFFQGGVDTIAKSETMLGKYSLLSNLGMTSTLRLFDNQRFSFMYAPTSADVDWSVSSDYVTLGLYADGGAENYLYLYSDNGSTCQVMRQSPEGDYLALLSLGGNLSSVQKTFSSPTDWRGYSIIGTLYDEQSNITFEFRDDSTAIKYLPDGSPITYAYYVDTEGLITLGCTEGVINKDYLWLDAERGMVYRVVYSKDSWTNYMAQLSLQTKQLLSSEPLGESISPSKILDMDRIVERGSKDVYLLCDVDVEYSPMFVYSISHDVNQAMTDFQNVQLQQTQLQSFNSTAQNLQENRNRRKEEFLANMSELAKQRAEEEERKKEVYVPVGGDTNSPSYSGYYSNITGENGRYTNSTVTPMQRPNADIDRPSGYIPENWQDDEERLKNAGPVQSNFGSSEPVPEESPRSVVDIMAEAGSVVQPINPPATSESVTIRYICNCRSCHQDSFPVAHGSTLLGLCDGDTWTSGSTIAIQEDNNLVIRLTDAKGDVPSNRIDVYIADHATVAELASGVKTVNRVSG